MRQSPGPEKRTQNNLTINFLFSGGGGGGFLGWIFFVFVFLLEVCSSTAVQQQVQYSLVGNLFLIY